MYTEYPQPPYPSQKQPMPGSTGKMNPRPDHGEESYKGSGKLKGMKAIITGDDSGIGRAVADHGRGDRRQTADIGLPLEGCSCRCRHCEELRDEAIHTFFAAAWIASRSLSSGAHSRDPVAHNDGKMKRPLTASAASG